MKESTPSKGTSQPSQSTTQGTSQSAGQSSGVGAVQGYSAQQLMLKPSGRPGFAEQLKGLSPRARTELDKLSGSDLEQLDELDGDAQAQMMDLEEGAVPDLGALRGNLSPMDQVDVQSDTPVQARRSSARVQKKATKVPAAAKASPRGKGDAEVPSGAAGFAQLVGEGKYTDAFKHLMGEPTSVASVGFKGLSASKKTAFCNALSWDADTASKKGKKVLYAFVFTTPALSNMTQLKKLFEVRFNVKVGQTLSTSKTGKAWDAKGLRRCWTVLEGLPSSHVVTNEMLEHWTRYDGGGSGSGFFSSGRKESAVAYDPAKIDDPNRAADNGDPLYGVTRFNKVVRHEVGHAVDAKWGCADTLCAKAANGAWKELGAPDSGVVTAIVNASNGKIKSWSDSAQKRKIEAALLKSIKDRKPDDLNTYFEAMDFWSGLDASKKAEIKNDKASKTVRKAGAGKSPWYNLGSMGIDCGGRHYQEAYKNRWVSYKKSALTRKVSTYQYRAPGEWFAEAYATYYEKDGDGKVGTILEGRDPSTKRWIDANVHNK